MNLPARRWWRPWTVVLVFLAVYLGVLLARASGDAEVFVTLGECFRQCAGHGGESCAEGAEGYDGQFAYYIARDPAQAPDCLDVPAYRMQRILLPLLGRLISLSRSALIPWALVAINGAALVISTALLAGLLRAERASPWFALSYGLFAGVVMAVRLSTPEPLAYGLAIAAIWLEQRGRLRASAAALALAAFAKETALVFSAGYALHFALNRRWRDLAQLVLIVGVPFMAWQIALFAWLGAFGAGSGGALATGFEIVPLMGLARIATEGSLAAFLLLGVLFAGPVAVLPALWGLWRSLRDLRAGWYDAYTCLLLANAALMLFVPFSTYREFLGLLRFIPGLVLTVVLYSARRHARRPLVYSTLWIVLLLFLVIG
ncbi:MAG TPA: hypothetical protein PKD46_00925 [Aggregatilineaceae bacterium]|nr:hypothetical protein [Aggregatilineaceae bacterium]